MCICTTVASHFKCADVGLTNHQIYSTVASLLRALFSVLRGFSHSKNKNDGDNTQSPLLILSPQDFQFEVANNERFREHMTKLCVS